jgi:hypothetical protein
MHSVTCYPRVAKSKSGGCSLLFLAEISHENFPDALIIQRTGFLSTRYGCTPGMQFQLNVMYFREDGMATKKLTAFPNKASKTLATR